MGVSGSPFGVAARSYWELGWHGTLWMPPGKKYPPPKGFTGHGAPYLSKSDVSGLLWEHEERGEVHNIALRMPPGVLGLDVDHYGEKRGGDTLAALEADLGALPPTWRSSARFDLDLVSGIRWFRVDENRSWKGEAGPDIETVHCGHRYAMVWPSRHPEGGTYGWELPSGVLANLGVLPQPSDLAVMPAAWQDNLAAPHRVIAATLDLKEISAWLRACRQTGPNVPMCPEIRNTLARYMSRLNGRGSRHETALNGTRALVAFGGEGHAGAEEACRSLGHAFIEATTAPKRGARVLDVADARYEFTEMMLGAVRLAAARNPSPRTGCPCPSWEGLDEWIGETGAAGMRGGAPSSESIPAAAAPVIDQANEPPAPVDEPEPTEAERSALVAESASAVADPPPIMVAPKSAQFYGYTQDGMAQALVDHFGDKIRYVVDGRVGWLAWDGMTWAFDSAKRHREYVKKLGRTLPQKGRTDDETKALVSWRKQCLSAAGVTAVAQLASSDPSVAIWQDLLDSDPWALNTPGGVYDMRTAKATPHDSGRLITQITPVAPDFEADRAVWLDFLAQTFDGDERLIAYMQRLIGYSATGFVGTHVLPFCHGDGGNGKGVLLETVLGVLGKGRNGYATTSPNGFLMERTYAEHETAIARLWGKRFVLCSEVKPDARFDEERVKALTGGDTITARFMNQDHFTFSPSHKLWLMGNDQPEVRAGGHSFWRRLRLIPFVHTVPEDRIIEDLQGILVREHGPAILAWIIEGARDYAAHGLQEPAAVKAATAAYAHEQDVLARFVEERLRLRVPGGVRTDTGRIFTAFEAFCRGESKATGVNPINLTKRLKKEHGIETERSNGKTWALGVLLVEPASDDDSDD